MIFTIGHSNHATKDFLDLLKKHKVQVLIDARTRPQSRFTPHFNRQPLAEILRKSGIEYQWRGQVLGGYNDISVEDPIFRKEMSLVLHEGKKKNIALMCSEGKPEECHRAMKLSAWILRNSEQKVTHILKDGTIDASELEKSQKNGWLNKGFKILEFKGDQLFLLL